MSEPLPSILINQNLLEKSLKEQGDFFCSSLSERHAHLYSAAVVPITADQLLQMQAVISAIEEVVALPAWSDQHAAPKNPGVFFGYDFHLNAEGVHLIEVNTNAGGAFLNALLIESQQEVALAGKMAAALDLERRFIEMFRHEWQCERGDAPLRMIAIVDDEPTAQYLYPEFILAQQALQRAGLAVSIAAPVAFTLAADGLYLGQQKIDMIYNRLTDFSLASYPQLLKALQQNQLVCTPHPQAYLRYADKRNLCRLTDFDFLHQLGVSASAVQVLQAGIPQTKLIGSQPAEDWWSERKNWFFKPVTGYGAKGAYRGDKLTKRVFEDIVSGDYVAQKLASPSECWVEVEGAKVALKFDIRCYVYEGRIQLIAARLYQGQTTNFRTEGGGFALVRVLD